MQAKETQSSSLSSTTKEERKDIVEVELKNNKSSFDKLLDSLSKNKNIFSTILYSHCLALNFIYSTLSSALFLFPTTSNKNHQHDHHPAYQTIDSLLRQTNNNKLESIVSSVQQISFHSNHAKELFDFFTHDLKLPILTPYEIQHTKNSSFVGPTCSGCIFLNNIRIEIVNTTNLFEWGNVFQPFFTFLLGNGDYSDGNANTTSDKATNVNINSSSDNKEDNVESEKKKRLDKIHTFGMIGLELCSFHSKKELKRREIPFTKKLQSFHDYYMTPSMLRIIQPSLLPPSSLPSSLTSSSTSATTTSSATSLNNHSTTTSLPNNNNNNSHSNPSTFIEKNQLPIFAFRKIFLMNSLLDYYKKYFYRNDPFRDSHFYLLKKHSLYNLLIKLMSEPYRKEINLAKKSKRSSFGTNINNISFDNRNLENFVMEYIALGILRIKFCKEIEFHTTAIKEDVNGLILFIKLFGNLYLECIEPYRHYLWKIRNINFRVICKEKSEMKELNRSYGISKLVLVVHSLDECQFQLSMKEIPFRLGTESIIIHHPLLKDINIVLCEH
ncbi:hypothetical protein ABK040_008982 [Willaertia magna]